MRKGLSLLYLFVFLFAAKCVLAADTTVVNGPDGRIQFKLFQLNKYLAYRVDFRRMPVLANSLIVYSLNDVSITGGVKIGKAPIKKINETYRLLGTHSIAHNQCNAAEIPISTNKTSYNLSIRVFNDGVAFRFIIPEALNESTIPDE